MRLKPWVRYAAYAVFAAMFVTGIVWLWADARKGDADGEYWQWLASWLLAVHGSLAAVTLLLLGGLLPVHVTRSWQARRDRVTGIVIVATNVLLIASAYGLYYAGAESLRSWFSNIHLFAGFSFPVLLAVHIVIGRWINRRGSTLKLRSKAWRESVAK